MSNKLTKEQEKAVENLVDKFYQDFEEITGMKNMMKFIHFFSPKDPIQFTASKGSRSTLPDCVNFMASIINTFFQDDETKIPFLIAIQKIVGQEIEDKITATPILN